jgi:N-acetyl sugar amidotransferase
MNRCLRCTIPDTRPDTPFIDGVCAACISFGKRPEVDWAARKRDLEALLERGRNGSGYDCIVPSSGGKDSTYQVLQLRALGARVLVVTATTCHLTPIGRANIDNLARYATTIEVTPSRNVRAKMNRIGLEQVGDISHPEHVAIFTTPFRVAAQYGIPLLFYGENPQNQYGGPIGSEEAKQLTRRWRSEFGGFLGLRPADLVGQYGITEDDVAEYLMPEEDALERAGVEAHFLGQYLGWDSHRNAEEAARHGMRQQKPCAANWWDFENVDNAQTGIHDHGMYRKYGYGRGCAQIAVDVREGRIHREDALEWVHQHDGEFPRVYAGVSFLDVLDRLEMTTVQFANVLNRFTNWPLFEAHPEMRRPPSAV